MLIIEEPLVSVEWLHKHLDAPNLIVLNGTIPKAVGNASELSTKQIPNARFFDIKKDFSDVNGQFPSTFPQEEQFQESARKLGINSDSAIVVYDDLGIYSSARVWWLFKAFGHDNIAVLDGGLPEWKKIGFDLEEKQNKEFLYGDFTANLRKDKMCFFDDIIEVSESNDKNILDARSEERFKCEVPEPRKGLRSGTIPNSKNLPYTSLLKDGKMKPKSELEYIFEAFGNKDSAYTFSCGSGITACVLALGAEIAARKNLTVYDGSWTEYGSLTD